jgi:hypothetical protein
LSVQNNTLYSRSSSRLHEMVEHVMPDKIRIPTSRASVMFQEIGENLVRNSLGTITEFNKFMIGTCLGAIPLFLGLLKLAVPDKQVLVGKSMAWSIAVIVVLLFGSFAAIFGYLPLSDRIGLQEPDQVKTAVQSAIVFRRLMAWCSIVLLIIGVILACILILFGFVG